MKIGNFDLEKDGTFIIAELSANHGGKIEIAKETIKAAKEIGANAIKLQTYTADTITLDSDNEDFIIKGGTLWDDRKLYDLYKEAYLPWEWHEALFNYARDIGIDIFSSPFDKSAVDFLEYFNPSAYKIASFEITDYELIRYTASKMRPIIISTGIATLEEIEEKGWSLNPGRYVGVPEGEVEDDEDFKIRLAELQEELEVLNSEAHELEKTIALNMARVLSL